MKRKHNSLEVKDLPEDIIHQITHHSYPTDVSNLKKTSSSLNGLITQEILIKISLLKALELGMYSEESKKLMSKEPIKAFLGNIGNIEGYDLLLLIISKLAPEKTKTTLYPIEKLNLSGSKWLDSAKLQAIITKCPDLKELVLKNCSPITYFNIPANSKLERFYILHNAMQSLTVEEGCEIKKIELFDCPNLTLNIPENSKITDLNLSGSKWLDSEKLQEIITNCPDLKELLLTDCSPITYFNIPANSKLERFYILHNAMQSLTVEEGCEIKKIELDDCPNLTLNIPENSKITDLNLSGSKLLNSAKLQAIITNCPDLKELLLTDCSPITYFNIPANSKLERFYILHNAMQSLTVEEGCEIKKIELFDCPNLTLNIPENSKITDLNLSGSKLLNSAKLQAIITNCPDLKELLLTDCSPITYFNIPANSKLERFYILHNAMQSLTVEEGCEIKKIELDDCPNLTLNIPENSKITDLNLTGSKLLNSAKLQAIITKCPDLKELALKDCSPITYFNIPANSKLERFYILHNAMQSLTVEEGCEIKKIELDDCPNLTLNIPENSKITDLNLTGSKLLNSAKLQAIITKCPDLKELALKDCSPITYFNIPANSKLKTIYIVNNTIGRLTLGADCRIEEIRLFDCPNLTTLNFPANSKIKKLTICSSSISSLSLISEGCEIEEVKLSDLSLTTFNIPANNKIQKFYISDNEDIRSLTLEPGCEIEEIKLNYNPKLTTLNFPANTKIKKLNLDHSVMNLTLEKGCEICNIKIKAEEDINQLREIFGNNIQISIREPITQAQGAIPTNNPAPTAHFSGQTYLGR